MNTAPDRNLSQLTEQLSRLLASEDGSNVLALLQGLALLSAEGASEPVLAASTESLRAGVWDPELQDDGTVEFVRSDACADEWRFWADVERIAPKRCARVVLLGESVARGYLYDPVITPAAMLEEMLSGGDDDVEVVDLARSDLTPQQLEPLLDLLPALEPDAVVLFAGNNWHNLVFRLDELHKLAHAVRNEGYAGCRRVFLEDILVPRCESLLDLLAATAREFDIAVVVVVPEFNLLDWRSEAAILAPTLREGRNASWMVARERSRDARADGRTDEAAALAREMIELDGGTSAIGHELLGEIALAAGRVSEARTHFETARDAVCGLLVPHSPRCPTAVQNVLRSKSREHGFALVDLPRVFEQHCGGRLPGRALFLDYCHLTVEGMTVAMEAVADALVPLVGDQANGLARMPGIAADDEAMGHFLAAIHNAHYGQSYEILCHHCMRAAEKSPAVRQDMLRFLDYGLRTAEQWTCATFDEIAESPIARRYLDASGVRGRDRLADFVLVDAIVHVLQRSGIDAAEPVEALLVDEHGSESIDLLATRFSAPTFRHLDGHSLGPPRAYYRAFDLRSSFYLVVPRPHPMHLRLTCRLRGANGERGDVGVVLNDVRVERLSAGDGWETFELLVDADTVRAGVNVVVLEWPPLAPPWEAELERAARRLERTVFPDVLPAHGEVHAFTAHRAG
jgi:hypothetical protein